MDNKIKFDINKRLLIELGINPDMKGFDYIDVGIDLCIKEASKDVFSAIAEKVGISKSVVASAIGSALKKVETPRLNYFLDKYDVAPFEKVPTYEVLVNLLAVVAFENQD